MKIEINSKLEITDNTDAIINGNCDNQIIIQKGAFGSGEHETTKACLELITELELSNKSVIDIGCGTGILSIAASKLGAKHIVGFDPFESACQTAQINNRINKTDNIDIVCAFNDAVNGTYDVVLANIYYYILLDLKEYIRDITTNNADIILSGIPFSENFDIRTAYEKMGFSVIKNMFHDEYTTILMRKQS